MRKLTGLPAQLVASLPTALVAATPQWPARRAPSRGSFPTPTAAAHNSGNVGTCLFVVAAACAYYVAIAPFLLGHTDLGWHLAAGDLIRSQGKIPEHDSWSFTAGDTRWYNLSWLWDVVESFLFQYGGFNALILAAIFLGGLIAGGLAAICLNRHATLVATCIAVIAACLLYPTFAVPDIFLAASPNIATLVFCVVFYGVCLEKRYLWLAPLAMLLWVNMHGGFVLGSFILGIFGATALLKRNAPDFATYLLVAAACLVATFVNPLGWHVYVGVFGTLGHFVQHYITEWQPYYRMLRVPQCITPCAYIVLFAVLEIADRRNGPVEARILSWCFLLLGFWQLRYLSIFFLFSAVPIAVHLSNLNSPFIKQRVSQYRMAMAALIIFAALPFLYWYVVPAKADLPPIYPDVEVAYLQQHFPHAHVLNHWNYGGYVIFRTRGEVPIFVDGRAATAYPDSVLRDYFELITWDVNQPAWEAALEKYHVEAVLWPKAHTPLAAFLVGKLGWTEAYSGKFANVYVRPRAPRE